MEYVWLRTGESGRRVGRVNRDRPGSTNFRFSIDVAIAGERERESKVLLYFYVYFPSPVLFLFFSMLFSGGKARLAIGCLYREMGTWVPYVLGMGPTHDESGLVRWDRMGLSLPWPVVLGGHGSFQVPKPAKMFELIFYVI